MPRLIQTILLLVTLSLVEGTVSPCTCLCPYGLTSGMAPCPNSHCKNLFECKDNGCLVYKLGSDGKDAKKCICLKGYIGKQCGVYQPGAVDKSTSLPPQDATTSVLLSPQAMTSSISLSQQANIKLTSLSPQPATAMLNVLSTFIDSTVHLSPQSISWIGALQTLPISHTNSRPALQSSTPGKIHNL